MKKTPHFIGIDLHKTVIQVCVLNHAGDVKEEFRFGNAWMSPRQRLQYSSACGDGRRRASLWWRLKA
jgi:hypothetical protein